MVQHPIPQVEFGWTMRICAFLILVSSGLSKFNHYFKHETYPEAVCNNRLCAADAGAKLHHDVCRKLLPLL